MVELIVWSREPEELGYAVAVLDTTSEPIMTAKRPSGAQRGPRRVFLRAFSVAVPRDPFNDGFYSG
jgi:hypothetical protein